MNLLLAACQRVEKETEAEREDNALSQESSDVKDDLTLLPHATFVEESFLEADSLSSKEKNDWKNDDEGRKESRLFA